MPRSAPARYVLNERHPLAKGLVACFVPDGRAGMRDLVRGVRLASQNGGRIVSTFAGNAADCNAAGGRGYRLTTPQHLRLGWPVTIVWAGIPLGAATAPLSQYFGVTFASAEGGTSIGFSLFQGTSGVTTFYFNSAGALLSFSGTGNVATLYANKFVAIGASAVTGSQKIYINGALNASASTAISNPTFGATSLTEIGSYTNQSRNLNANSLIGLIYNRVLSDSEHRALAQDPFCMLRPARATLGKAPTATWFPWRLKFTGTTTQGL